MCVCLHVCVCVCATYSFLNMVVVVPDVVIVVVTLSHSLENVLVHNCTHEREGDGGEDARISTAGQPTPTHRKRILEHAASSVLTWRDTRPCQE
jgi:hypothetical protein